MLRASSNILRCVSLSQTQDQDLVEAFSLIAGGTHVPVSPAAEQAYKVDSKVISKTLSGLSCALFPASALQ